MGSMVNISDTDKFGMPCNEKKLTCLIICV